MNKAFCRAKLAKWAKKSKRMGLCLLCFAFFTFFARQLPAAGPFFGYTYDGSGNLIATNVHFTPLSGPQIYGNGVAIAYVTNVVSDAHGYYTVNLVPADYRCQIGASARDAFIVSITNNNLSGNLTNFISSTLYYNTSAIPTGPQGPQGVAGATGPQGPAGIISPLTNSIDAAGHDGTNFNNVAALTFSGDGSQLTGLAAPIYDDQGDAILSYDYSSGRFFPDTVITALTVSILRISSGGAGSGFGGSLFTFTNGLSVERGFSVTGGLSVTDGMSVAGGLSVDTITAQSVSALSSAATVLPLNQGASLSQTPLWTNSTGGPVVVSIFGGVDVLTSASGTLALQLRATNYSTGGYTVSLPSINTSTRGYTAFTPSSMIVSNTTVLLYNTLLIGTASYNLYLRVQ